MKKLLAVMIVLAMACSLSACGSNGQKVRENADQSAQKQEDGAMDESDDSEVPSEFNVVAGDDQIYEELTFENDLTITIDTEATMDHRAQITFAGCTFNGKIKVVGDLSAFIRFVEGCVFGENCEITVVEATEGAKDKTIIEDDLVKLLFDGSSTEVHAESVCNVFCYNGEGVVVDGVEYKKTDFPDYPGFCVATYFENGEKKVFTAGVDE